MFQNGSAESAELPTVSRISPENGSAESAELPTVSRISPENGSAESAIFTTSNTPEGFADIADPYTHEKTLEEDHPEGFADIADPYTHEKTLEGTPVDIADIAEPFWSEETLLGEGLTEFPTHVLPEPMRSLVESVAGNTQTPTAAVVNVALGTAAAASRVSVQAGPGWVEPGNLYTLCVLPPGSRKTPVFKTITGPLRQVELEARKEWRLTAGQKELRRNVLEDAMARRTKLAATEAATSKGVISSETEAELDGLRLALAELELDLEPQLIGDDITPEELATRLAESGGRFAVLAPEGGGLFAIAAGRYSAGVSNQEILLKGWSGDPCRVDRRGRSEEITAPRLTVVTAAQPDVLRAVGGSKELSSRGLMDRFLIAAPRSTVGHREVRNIPDLNPVAVTAWGAVITRLAATPEQLLNLTPDAREEFLLFQETLEHRLGNDLRPVLGWASKLAGQVARIAGVLTAVLDETVISAETMRAAIIIGGHYLEHAEAVHAHMGQVRAGDRVRWAWETITRHGFDTFTTRDLFTVASRSRFPRVSDLETALTSLAAHGQLLELQPDPKRGPGRPASSRYQVATETVTE